MARLQALTLGSGILDIFIQSPQFRLDREETGVWLCGKYDAKLEIKDLVMTSGGGATNVAVGLARQNVKAGIVCELGSDPAGKMVLSELKREGVEIGGVIQEEEEQTAVSVILVAKEGGRTILVHRGASRMLTKEDINLNWWEKNLEQSGWVYMSNLGEQWGVIGKVIDWVNQTGRKLCWNPGMDEIRNPKFEIRNGFEILMLNQKEYQELKTENYKLKANYLVVTKGSKGGEVLRDGRKIYEWKAKKVEVIDSTGAGDAFGSGLVGGLIRGFSWEQAIESAKKNAANVIKFVGAKKGLIK
jgi:ribokinase